MFAAALWGKFSRSGFRALSSAAAGMIPARLSGMSSFLAGATLGVQLFIVIAIFTPAFRFALVLSLVLLAFFILGMVKVIRSRQILVCSCFAGESDPIGTTEVIRNLILFLAAGLGLTASMISSEPPLSPLALFSASAIAISTAIVLVRASDVVAIVRPSMDRT